MSATEQSVQLATTPAPTFNVERVRGDFPALHQSIRDKPLVYLDNGATSQKPQSVIDAMTRYYTEDNANVHRGVHTLSERATRSYEGARDTVQHFINAADRHEIILLRGTTEATNLVAQAYARPRLQPDDEILITEMEHHANIVPWQMVCQQTGARLRVVPVSDRGELIMDEFYKLLGERTRLVAVVHVSNALGTINPVKEIVAAAHALDVPVLFDGAQSIPHLAVDVQDLDCDFYAFSAHKAFGPTGIGALYGKAELLEEMEPYQGGGDMIRKVSFEETLYNALPYKFEAGTPNIAGTIGMAAALDYIGAVGIGAMAAHEQALLHYATEALQATPGLRIIGTAKEKTGIISFVMDGAHPHDIGTIMDNEGVAIRAGHHCTMPLMKRFGIPGTARASLALYNTQEDVDAFLTGIERVREVFS